MTIVKSFEYRGIYEEWSNQYHLSGVGADAAAHRAIADDLIALEIACYSERVTVRRVLVYADSDAPSIYTYDLASFAGVVTGELDSTSGVTQAGDAAGWVRWDTGKTSSTGKKVYLRKYFHDPHASSDATPDTLSASWVTQYQGFGDSMLADFSGTVHMVDPEGDDPPGPALAGPYITTRTLKRRGRRP
jgi:hypothetical protein